MRSCLIFNETRLPLSSPEHYEVMRSKVSFFKISYNNSQQVFLYRMQLTEYIVAAFIQFIFIACRLLIANKILSAHYIANE